MRTVQEKEALRSMLEPWERYRSLRRRRVTVWVGGGEGRREGVRWDGAIE